MRSTVSFLAFSLTVLCAWALFDARDASASDPRAAGVVAHDDDTAAGGTRLFELVASLCALGGVALLAVSSASDQRDVRLARNKPMSATMGHKTNATPSASGALPT